MTGRSLRVALLFTFLQLQYSSVSYDYNQHIWWVPISPNIGHFSLSPDWSNRWLAANLAKSVAKNDQNQILTTTLPFYSSLVCHVTSLVDTIRGAGPGDMVGLPVGTSLLHLFLHLKHSYY